MKMLEIKKISKEYGDMIAVNDIDLVVNEGEIFGILGPNGAGKSTLIGMICGLIKRTSGEIIYEEKETKPRNFKEHIGIVPQDFALYWDLTAEENIEFFCSLYGFRGKDLKTRVNKVLDFVGLTEVRNKKASEFSGGMKRRLNIGCAIAHSPKIIIMDEPTVGIDPQSRNHILKSVLKLRDEGATVIYTSHYMQEVDDICDRIAIVDKGNVIAEGTSEELKNLIGDKRVLNITVKEKIDNFEDKLLEITGIEKVAYSEKQYKISTIKNANLLTKIIETALSLGGEIVNVENSEITLENVFLALTGKKLRD